MTLVQDQATGSSDLNLAVGKLAVGKVTKTTKSVSKDGDEGDEDDADERRRQLEELIRRALAQEHPTELTKELVATLTLESVGAPVVLQEPDKNAGVMRIRVPFFVGNSKTRSPGINKPLYFSDRLLPGIVQEAKARLTDGKQPITVYARHSHAIAKDHLPIGAVVDVEQEGRLGWATIDLAPTQPDGANAQMLIQHRMLNAVSLRSHEFELQARTINQESMYDVQSLRLEGIDLAPDGPAQETYGIEVLHQEAVIEPVQDDSAKRNKNNLDEITLESVPANVREQIEAPLRKDIEELKSQVTKLTQERQASELQGYIRDVASKHPKPEEALNLLQALATEKGVTTAAEMSQHVAPILMEALVAVRNTTPPEPKVDPARRFLETFLPQSNGQGSTTPPADGTPALLQEVPSYRVCAGGLIAPEF